MMLTNQAWGFSLFGDDLRQEVGNKISLMGIYGDEMVAVGEFPLLLPKLVILVNYFETLDAFHEDLELQIYMPGEDEPKAQPITRAEIESTIRPSIKGTEQLFSARLPVIFSPFRADGEGAIKVRMKCGDVVTKLGQLRVRSATEDEKSSF